MNHAAFLPSRSADTTPAGAGAPDYRAGDAPGGGARPDAEAAQRVVLDTQIVMDWLVFDEPRVMPLIALVESRHLRWTATPAMKAEMLHVLGRGVAARYAPDMARIEAAFGNHCEFVDEPVLGMSRPRCSDEDDQKFIDLALYLVAQGPTTLVSRDRAVLKVAKRALRMGLDILTPESWLKRNGATVSGVSGVSGDSSSATAP